MRQWLKYSYLVAFVATNVSLQTLRLCVALMFECVNVAYICDCGLFPFGLFFGQAFLETLLLLSWCTVGHALSFKGHSSYYLKEKKKFITKLFFIEK